MAGNGNIIRNLLKQVKKSYSKESDNIIETNNK